MKKLLTSLLCVMMVVCFMPAMAWAEGDDAAVYVAEVNGSKYESLASAVDAAAENGTVKLLTDVTSGVADKSNFWITKSITLDLNNCTLTGAYQIAVGVNSDVNVKICNGTLTGGSSYIVYATDGNLELENVVVGGNSNAVWVRKSSEVTIGSGTTVNGMVVVWGDDTYGSEECKTPTLNVYGTVQNTGAQAVSTNGMDYSQPVINVYDGAVITAMDAAAMYIPNSGSVNVFGGTITGEASAIAIKCGTLNISGGTLTATGEDSTPTEGYSNGINASGAAIQIESNDAYKLNADTPGTVKINITGGKVVSENGYAIYEYVAKKGEENTPLAKDTHLANLTISGGEISGNTEKACMLISEELAGKDEAVSLTGGIYSSDIKAYVAESAAIATLTSGGETYYYIGETANQISDAAESGDKVEVIQGSLTLSKVKDGVVVLNSGDGAVSVNNTPVAKNDSVTTYTPVYIPTIPTIPTTQKPVIEPNADVTTSLSTDGTTLTIKANDGYEITDVTVNGVSKGAVTTLTGLKTGDKVIITTKKIETPDDNAALIEAVKNTKLIARSAMSTAKGKKAVKVSWHAEDGSDLEFDGYEVFRSLRRYSGFGTKPIFKTANEKYYNTAIKKGNKYYYKVRAYKVIDGEKVYTDWSTKAWRTVK